jgi:hypothetical protein
MKFKSRKWFLEAQKKGRARRVAELPVLVEQPINWGAFPVGSNDSSDAPPQVWTKAGINVPGIEAMLQDCFHDVPPEEWGPGSRAPIEKSSGLGG